MAVQSRFQPLPGTKVHMNHSMRMTVMMVFLLALLPLPVQDPATQKSEAPGVEISAQLLPPNRFCEYGPKAYVAYFPIAITVTNGRRTPIIVARQLAVQRLLISANISDLWAHKYELETHLEGLRIYGHDADFGPPPSSNAFVVLKHNQAYDFTMVQGIAVRNNAADSVPGTVPVGDHTMSLELQTWPYARDPGTVVNQWSRSGDLIATPVSSFPAPVKLMANPVVQKCGLTPPKE
jgi:hypothetical protein